MGEGYLNLEYRTNNLTNRIYMKIKIKRESKLINRFRAYKIILDGICVEKIKNNQNIELNIKPGNHEIYLKIDWCKSNKVKFRGDSNLLRFECGSNPKITNINKYIFYPHLWDKYLWIKQL